MKANSLKTLVLAFCFAPLAAFANTSVHLDRAPDVQGDPAALQNGAKIFVNYCLTCHGASQLRYNRLTELGLTEEQVKDNLMFTADKIGEQMKIAARPEEQKKWFGATPPDLSLIARSRASGDGSGADWLYTYLRSFYRDENRPTGWNNVIFENVGMPHVLWQLQGEQHFDHENHKLELVVPGQLSPEEYDKQIGDLVGFLVWAAEPEAGLRKKIGVGVLLFLGVLFAAAYLLKKEYWKDVH
ncbi:cytochrome c1 [Rhodocyclus tenuis]|uniref:Cytochrome c1 n=2 Tax=Rhodocyclus TaxID=1064 RepID=A0A6L5JXP1_RHOTE|nr:cytochrome c1 [Rhodocyclus gracilis]MQY52095.1 cytochrome c1 [Rhodocyclus gracilis]NJA89644.1 cytochrome c1 [Rhodocyclus gracilis]